MASRSKRDYRSPVPISSMRGRNIPDYLHEGWRALEAEREKLVLEYGEAKEVLDKAEAKVNAAQEAASKAGRKAGELHMRLEKVQVAQAAMDPLEKQALDRRLAQQKEGEA